MKLTPGGPTNMRSFLSVVSEELKTYSLTYLSLKFGVTWYFLCSLIIYSFNTSNTVQPVYNDHHRDLKIIMNIVDRWLLFTGSFMSYTLKSVPENSGRCRQVVAIWRFVVNSGLNVLLWNVTTANYESYLVSISPTFYVQLLHS